MSHSNSHIGVPASTTQSSVPVLSGVTAVPGSELYAPGESMSLLNSSILLLIAFLCAAIGYLLVTEDAVVPKLYTATLKHLRVRPVERTHMPRVVR